MSLVSSAFKPHVEKWLAGIQEIRDPTKDLGTVRADSILMGDELQEAKMRNYTLVCDGCFCENVTFARFAAALRGLEFDSLETSVRGHG